MSDRIMRGFVATALALFVLLLVGCATDYAAYDTYQYRSGPYYYPDDYWGHYYYDPFWYGYGYYPWYGHRRYPPRHGGGGHSRGKGKKFVPPSADGGPGKTAIGDRPRGGGSVQRQRPGGGFRGRAPDRGRSESGAGSGGFNRQVN